MRVRFTKAHIAPSIAAASMLAAIAVVCSPAARVLAKQLCDPIAHATSGGAALYTLLFIAVTALVMMRRAHAPDCTASTREFALLGTLLAGNAANTLAHALALRAMGLPITLPVYQWSGADNTYSYLFHSHAGKAALTAGLSVLAGPLTLDIGQGWGVALPSWAAAACGLALAASLALYVNSLRGLAARFGNNVWVTILYALAVLNAAKGVADGGLLSYRVLPSLIVIAALVTTRNCRQMAQRTPAWLAGGGALLGAYLLLWRSLSPVDASEPFAAFFAYIALLSVPALLAWKPFDTLREQCVRPALHGAVLVVALSVVAQQYSSDAREGTGLLWKPLAQGYRALYVDPGSLATSTWDIGGQRPLDVYLRAGDDPLKPRHVLIIGRAQAPPAEFALAILGGSEGSAARNTLATPPWRLHASGIRTHRDDLRIISLSAATPALAGAFAAAGQLAQNNYYCLLHGLSAQLRAAGLGSFTLAPLRDEADLDSVLHGAAKRTLSAGNVRARLP
jgi:hypothetical protein